MKAPTPEQLAQQKLASSGLAPSSLKALGIDVLDAKEMGKLWPNFPVPAMRLNYFDVNGKIRKGISRVRLLAKMVDRFGGESKIRYLQLPNTPPAAYFPRNENWGEIASDPNRSILVTEGELKAAAGCAAGFATIGLGGVWSWRSKVYGWDLLPELEAFDWKKRRTYIVFDSDASTNPDIASAMAHLAKTLRDRGAMVAIPKLPDVYHDGRKTGLDDYLVEVGRTEGVDAAATALDLLFGETDGDEMGARMWDYNARFALVQSPPIVVDEVSGLRHTFADYVKIHGNDKAGVMKGSGDNSKVVAEPVPKYWLEWPHRRTLTRLTYEPGQPRIYNGDWNEWAGWGVEPVEGDIKPWKELLDKLFESSTSVERLWFERWCMYPLKHAGSKLNTAALIWSKKHGLGKSNVGDVLKRIYGSNGYVIGQDELEGDFNFWAARRQFVMVDDVSEHANKRKADKLKKTITQDEVTINEKNVKQYKLRDCINYYLTSNRANALFLDPGDRRFFIFQTHAPKPDDAWFDRFYYWKNNGGPAALFWHALNEFDFGDFSPFAAPPLTLSKEDMTDSSRNEVETWLDAVKDSPDELLRLGRGKLDRDLFTPAEMAMMYEQQNGGAKCNAARMGIALQQNFARVSGGRLRIAGVAERLYIIRNDAKWKKASPKECIAHVEKSKSFEQQATKGKF